MTSKELREYLLPRAAEREPGFRHELDTISQRGLQVIAAVLLGVPLFEGAISLTVLPRAWAALSWVWEPILLALLGGAILLVLGLPGGQRHARLLGVGSGALTGAILIWTTLLTARIDEQVVHTIPGKLAVVMLVGVAAVPMRPLQALGLGLSFGLSHQLLIAGAFGLGIMPSAPWETIHLIFIAMLALLATALTAVVYAQRHASYLAHRAAVKASEELCQVQSRVLLAENAAALGRVAAAISHEFNSPIGSLMSGVETLTGMAQRLNDAGPAERQRLLELQSDLCRTIRESARRLQQMVGRIQRFTNLERAEILAADLNQLLSDSAALMEPELRENVRLDLQLQPVPPVVCRPEQMSAVFSSLLSNAIRAVNGDGKIGVSTARIGDQVEVRIEDDGRGMSPEELAQIFTPGFKVEAGRVAAGNWSLFSSRQIVHEHGGEIEIESASGKGTLVRVRLPFGAQQPAALSA
ncbi:MAG TPA: HAMP domain-containing sensor histidine kinase [Acidobacteriota bacterium]